MNRILLLVLVTLVFTGCCAVVSFLTCPISNFHEVSGTPLYRSAQPSAKDFKDIESLGIKSVVSLRSFHSDECLLRDTNLIYHPICMKAWHPEEEDIVDFLKFVTNPQNQPVLVHCQHGSDRTGTMVAMYRRVVQRWSKEKAIDEMVNGGFGFHPIWENLVAWIDSVDVEKIKKQLDIHE